jgi:transposase
MLISDKEVSMQVIAHHSLEALRQVAKRERDALLRIRIQIIILATQGRTAPQISQALSMSRRNLQRWVKLYNDQGLEGLKDRRGGNHRHLKTDQEQQIADYLTSTAADPRDGVRRGEDLRRWIEGQFGVVYSLTGAYDLLHRLGFSWLMPRPRHAKASKEAQDEFKKKRPRKSK